MRGEVVDTKGILVIITAFVLFVGSIYVLLSAVFGRRLGYLVLSVAFFAWGFHSALSKGGLYHHFQSKDEILFEIMNHAMELTQERVINPVKAIAELSSVQPAE